MRRVRVLYFAAVRELLQNAEESLTLPDSVHTVAQLVEHLEQIHPELRGRLAGVRLAVNETFADATQRLEEADVVAVIPPVAGG